MNRLRPALAIILVAAVFVSCAKAEIRNSEPVVQSRYAYDADFENIKEAILKKDLRTLQDYSDTDAVDAEMVIQSFHADSDFLNQLKAADYDDLKTEDHDGEIRLVFSVYVSGSDEEGNVYESGLYLYFVQGKPSLRLVNFLAAG